MFESEAELLGEETTRNKSKSLLSKSFEKSHSQKIVKPCTKFIKQEQPYPHEEKTQKMRARGTKNDRALEPQAARNWRNATIKVKDLTYKTARTAREHKDSWDRHTQVHSSIHQHSSKSMKKQNDKMREEVRLEKCSQHKRMGTEKACKMTGRPKIHAIARDNHFMLWINKSFSLQVATT